MEFKSVIGLEIHVQLFTKSKVFCGCSTKFGSSPNTQVCPVCLGLPGVLPVLNKESLNLAVKVALALNCKIAKIVKFDRKNYFYPDLPKNYQISQYDKPLAKDGYIYIPGDAKDEKRVRIRRVHLEEDAGKLIHIDGKYSLVDFNRTGVPLLEIVTEPDISSPEEAYSLLDMLKIILKYLEVSDCNMEEGSLRCDANISIKSSDSEKEGTKAEVKNMNSFKGVRNALQYEFDRQVKELRNGRRIFQETRLWNESEKVTTPMRSKEEAHDYRYFPEPDLVVFYITKDRIELIESSLPEMPKERRKRLVNEYKIPQYDAGVLTADKSIADYFEGCCQLFDDYKLISNWIMGQLLEILNEKKINLEGLGLSPKKFIGLLELLKEGKINTSTAKDVFSKMIVSDKPPSQIIKKENLLQISDEDKLESIIKKIIYENEQSVNDYKAGKEKALMYLVGQVMRETKGKANPKIVNKMLSHELKL